MKRFSLRQRFLLVAMASVTVALVLAFLGLSSLFASHVERRALAELSVQLDQILAGVERNATGDIVVGTVPADARFSKPFGGLYWQIEVEGRQLRSRSLWDTALDLPSDHLQDGATHVHTLAGPRNSQLLSSERSVTLPVRLGGASMRVAIAMDAAQLVESLAEFRADLLPYTALLAAFLILASALQVVFGLRPLNVVEQRVARVRTGECSRVGEDFPREILPLASEVDALLRQREKDIERARHRAGDLAHGLKTPLQALMGETSRLREAGDPARAESIEQVADSMLRHVERELTRVRIAARTADALSYLSTEARRVMAVMQRAGRQGDLEWGANIPSHIRIAAAAEDLSEILGALLENAARHAATKVDITAREEGDEAVLEIRDDGRGIPPEKIVLLQQRGIRLDEGGIGTGLGLAIAAEISEAVGGSLTLSDGAPGLIAQVRLPLFSS